MTDGNRDQIISAGANLNGALVIYKHIEQD